MATYSLSIIIIYSLVTGVCGCHPTSLLISEVDNQNGIDEFIELFLPSGLGGSLDGFCVVIWGDVSTKKDGVRVQVTHQFDLAGYETNENGYFVIGGPKLDVNPATTCCNSSIKTGYLRVEEDQWIPGPNDGGQNINDVIISVYYGGNCDFNETTFYTDADKTNIRENLIDTVPTGKGEFTKLFNDLYDNKNLQTFGGSKSHSRCIDDEKCDGQSQPGGTPLATTGENDCYKDTVPSPGTANNCL